MTAALAALMLLLEVAAVTLVVRHAGAAERPGSHGSAQVAALEPNALRVGDTAKITPDGDRSTERETSRHLLAEIERSMPVFSRPGGRRVGTVPAASPYYGEPTVAWVLEVSEDGRFGRVSIPYTGRNVTGWLRLRGLQISTTTVSVRADLSRHRLWVLRGERVVFTARAATGAPVSPTPTGRYVVSDRVAFPGGGVLGNYAFGLSGIQPNLPPGWSGGNQLAIHGTNDPSSIGRSASAGCLRVSERVLDRLKRLLPVGTPVVVRA